MPMAYTDHDKNLAASFVLSIDDAPIMFQFPPKVVNDSRKGEWSEKKIPGNEPVATIAKPEAHTYTIQWVYIVDGASWSAKAIQSQLRHLRGYWLYGDDDQLVVMVKFWGIGGSEETSARITDVDVKHGETIVGEGDEAFPLRTDVSVTVKLWYKTGEKGDLEKVQDIDKLHPQPDFEWY